MNDSELDRLLRAPRGDVATPPRFQSEVWSRIERTDERTISAGWHRFLAAFARPVPALASVSAMLALGLLLGSLESPDPADAQLGYARSISPFHQEVSR